MKEKAQRSLSARKAAETRKRRRSTADGSVPESTRRKQTLSAAARMMSTMALAAVIPAAVMPAIVMPAAAMKLSVGWEASDGVDSDAWANEVYLSFGGSCC